MSICFPLIFHIDTDFDTFCRQKRVRFPKGKKVKPGDADYQLPRDQIDDDVDVNLPTVPLPPQLAAEERAKRRTQLTTQLFHEDATGMLGPADTIAAEIRYEVTLIYLFLLVYLFRVLKVSS